MGVGRAAETLAIEYKMVLPDPQTYSDIHGETPVPALPIDRILTFYSSHSKVEV